MEIALIGSSGAYLQTNVVCLGSHEAENGKKHLCKTSSEVGKLLQETRGNLSQGA